MLLDLRQAGRDPDEEALPRVQAAKDADLFTFVNKMDRPGREPFDLVGEVEHVLGIGVVPITWPIYRGATFRGIYHRLLKKVFLFDAARAGSSTTAGA